MSIEKFDNLITKYIEDSKEIMKNSKPFAGMLGFGGGIKNDPIHLRFFDELEAAVKEDDGDPYESVKFLLTAGSKYECPRTIEFMFTAIQGLAVHLAPKMSREQKDDIMKYMDENIPKRTRLPNQKNLYDTLKK